MTEMTLEEWADLPEDEEGELVDGRLEEEEMPGLRVGSQVRGAEEDRPQA